MRCRKRCVPRSVRCHGLPLHAGGVTHLCACLPRCACQMETQHNTYEAQLRQDLDARGVELAAVREEVKQLRLTLEDRDRTIARFRDATTRLAVCSTHTHTHTHGTVA